MTQRFVLDENVVIFAQLEANDAGERDVTCASLITQIIDICHTIVLDYPLWERYQHQLNQSVHQRPQSGSLLLRILANAVQRSGKVELRSQSPTFAEEGTIPRGSRDDVPIIRLAIVSDATLVTTDDPLRDDLHSCGVQEKYNLNVLTPGQALSSL